MADDSRKSADEKLNSLNQLIEMKVISQNNFMASNDNAKTVSSYASKVRDIQAWVS